jgi:hypothetical protein
MQPTNLHHSSAEMSPPVPQSPSSHVTRSDHPAGSVPTQQPRPSTGTDSHRRAPHSPTARSKSTRSNPHSLVVVEAEAA